MLETLCDALTNSRLFCACRVCGKALGAQKFDLDFDRDGL